MRARRYVWIEKNAVIRVSDISRAEENSISMWQDRISRKILPLPVHGAFNVENAVAAIAAAWSMGIGFADQGKPPWRHRSGKDGDV